MTTKLDHWISSPYCFCKDLPWLVLSGIPAAPTKILGGMDWEDLSILAASLIALAAFLFLLFLLLCLLCPGGLCCGPAAACCGKGKDEKKKKMAGTSSAKAVEMSTFGSSDSGNLTAVDLKLPRAWMDASKGEMVEDGDLGLGLGQFGTNKTWSGVNGDVSSGFGGRSGKMGQDKVVYGGDASSAVDGYRSGKFGHENWGYVSDASPALGYRSGKHGHHIGSRSGYSAGILMGVDDDWLDGDADRDSGRIDYYRNRSATSGSANGGGRDSGRVDYFRTRSATSASANGGGNVRDTVQEWESRTMETRRLVESRQTREAEDVYPRAGGRDFGRSVKGLESGYITRGIVDEAESSKSTVQESSHQEAMSSESQMTSSNMALVKSSGSGAGNLATPGEDVYQCYTVTKKTTTTTYGNEEGEEETAVVTTTEKKWREGMNEVGEISVSASASAGELLPSIGAPAHVLADTNNVRTVKSLTEVDGATSDVFRRYEFQQTSKNGDIIL